MGVFKIDVKDFVWIDDSRDDPNDLCLHGTVNVTIGEERFQFGTTVSAAALYMLKSLTEDHLADDVIQMLPCCGHFMIANEDLTEVVITGCGMGIDWKVLHSGDNVKLITETGIETIVPMEEYRAEVFCFADKVEAFYNRCSPKIIPEDVFERNGYIAFWNEWHRRRHA